MQFIISLEESCQSIKHRECEMFTKLIRATICVSIMPWGLNKLLKFISILNTIPYYSMLQSR